MDLLGKKETENALREKDWCGYTGLAKVLWDGADGNGAKGTQIRDTIFSHKYFAKTELGLLFWKLKELDGTGTSDEN